MQKTNTRLSYLFQRYLDRNATQPELQELTDWLAGSKDSDSLEHVLEPLLANSLAGSEHSTLHKDHVRKKVYEQIARTHAQPLNPEHRLLFLRTSWFRYAAAVILVFGVAAYIWTTSNKTEQTVADRSKPLQTDIAPGGERAILTLADGRTIVLDSAANGHLADQPGADIVKLANGQIAYTLQGATSKEAMWNTMSTPRGGQYKLTLPDGTNVWLNAASSITFPAAFVSTERKVKVAGEAYFEVAKNKEKPFIVDVDGKSTVQVIGTSFNINSYYDEGTIKTTLLEGSVKVISGAATTNSSSAGRNTKPSGTDYNHAVSVVLKPGHQAQISIRAAGASDQPLKVIDNADIDQVLAWKNGIFNFDGAGLKEVMLQLERWYDIQVRYEGKVPAVQFKGKMNRGVKLSTVLNWFSELGIKTRLEGRTLIVLK